MLFNGLRTLPPLRLLVVIPFLVLKAFIRFEILRDISFVLRGGLYAGLKIQDFF